MSLESCLAQFPVDHDDLETIRSLSKGAMEDGKAVKTHIKLLSSELEGLRGQLIDAGHDVKVPLGGKLYSGKDQRLTVADNPVDKAIKTMLKSNKDLSPQDLKSLASEIVDRILSTPDGRLSYDAPSGGPKVGMPSDGPPPRGPLAHRQFMIPDHMIEPWLVNDVERVANSYLNTMVPDTLLTQRFGSVDMEESFKKLRDEHTALRETTKGAEALKQLDAEYRSAVTDLAGVRDRLRHVYGSNMGDPLKNVARWSSTLGRYVNLADMGGSGISQFNDLVGGVWRYGFGKVFRDGFMPYFQGLRDIESGSREGMRQWRAAGIGAEMKLDMRPIQEVGEEYHPHSKFERTIKGAADMYMIANMSAPITSTAKGITSIVASSELLHSAKALVEGTATAKQLRNLGEMSITPDLAQRIVDNFSKSGELRDGVMLPNTGDWTDKAAKLAFEGAVSREVNIAVVTPGQEKPLLLSNPIIRLIGQFKSFTGSATTRILLAGLQRRDAEFLQGVVAHIAAGMLSYKVYSIVSGRETSANWEDWVKEGISRAGIMGWYDEGNALLSKFSAGQLDAYKAIGATKPLTRYASRTWVGQVFGPTYGLADSAVQAIYGFADGKVSPQDVDNIRRILPFQNFFATRLLLDKVDESAAQMMGGPARQHP